MKTPVLSLLLISGVFSFSGCTSYSSRLDDSNSILTESARHYIEAADNSLPDNPTQAKTYVRYAKEVLGPPAEDLSTDQLEDRHKRDAKVLAERNKAESKLIELGRVKEAENNKSLISKIWHWALSTFGLLGGIAFLIFCPGIAIPLGLKLLGWLVSTIVSMIPSLISFVGVVGKSAFDNVVTGIGKARAELKANPEKTYTASEVQKILDTHLAISTDVSDKKLIESRRGSLDV